MAGERMNSILISNTAGRFLRVRPVFNDLAHISIFSTNRFLKLLRK